MTQLIAPAKYIPIGSHIVNSSLSSNQTIGIPEHSDGIIVQAIAQNVRIRLDGSPATTSVGFQIRAGDPPVYIPIKPNSIINAIQEAATATLQVQAVAFS